MLHVDLPKPEAAADPLALLGAFHETMRDVIAWAPWIVDDGGAANANEARFLRAFLDGPLVWHHNDEEIALAPRLVVRHAVWLDGAVASLERGHARIEASAAELVALLDPLCRGEPVDVRAWRARATHFADVVERALSIEDDVLLPAARLTLDDQDLVDILAALRSSADARPRIAALAEPPLLPRSVGRVVTVQARAHDRELNVVREYADCPKRRSISTETCAQCTHLERLEGEHIWCSIDETRGAARVADIMTRDVTCVSRDALLIDVVDALAKSGGSGAPVLDHRGRAIGVVSQTDITRILSQRGELSRITVADVMMHAAFVIDENDSIERAAALISFEGVHRLPVVNSLGEVVGIVSALDLVRWATRSLGTL